jgi:hypothetical protein
MRSTDPPEQFDRYVFFSGPDAPADKPAIVQIFTRVLKAIEKKLQQSLTAYPNNPSEPRGGQNGDAKSC